MLVLMASCGLMGIHFQIHNPKKAGKYPKFTRGDILLGALTPIRNGFDVHFYNLDIEINPKKKILSGWVEIRATAKEDIDSIQLDLYKNMHLLSLKWGSRTGSDLAYKREYGAVFIKLPSRVLKGTDFSVHVQYKGAPVVAPKPPWNGGVVWKKDKDKNPWVGVACETQGGSLWFPCKDHTSDEPDSARMTFSTTEEKMVLVSNGKFLGKKNENGLYSYSWGVSNPINVYNITYYGGNFELIQDTFTGINGKKLLLSYYVLPLNYEKAKMHFKQVKTHLEVYEQLYDEFPWYEDGFKLVESPYAGMEHQSAIAYGNGYKNDLNDKDDYILLHETGHEWFGNAITASDLADVWLQEGITTYGEALYLEKMYGQEAALRHMLFYRFTIKNKLPLVGPRDRRYFSYKDSDPYTKGAWVLHTLRNYLVDDSLFFSILRTFYKENKGKVTDSKTFIETVNRLTGKDYNWFFNQYLYERKVPIMEYYVDFQKRELYYRWKDALPEFTKMGVKILIDKRESEWIFPSHSIKKLDLKLYGFYESLRLLNNDFLYGIEENKDLYAQAVLGK